MNTTHDDTQMVVFTVGHERYALPTTTAREVLELRPTRSLPGSGACVRGVVSLRGEIVPVLQLSRVLATAGAEELSGTHLVVCDTDRGPVALIADDVSSVRELAHVSRAQQADLHPAATAVAVTERDQLVVVLDIERIVDEANSIHLNASSDQEAAA